jgi:hypothetical protein
MLPVQPLRILAFWAANSSSVRIPWFLSSARSLSCWTVPVVGHEGDVEDADDAAVHEVQQQRLHLTGGGLLAGPLQDHIVDRAQLLQLLVAHDVLLSSHATTRRPA